MHISQNASNCRYNVGSMLYTVMYSVYASALAVISSVAAIRLGVGSYVYHDHCIVAQQKTKPASTSGQT